MSLTPAVGSAPAIVSEHRAAAADRSILSPETVRVASGSDGPTLSDDGRIVAYYRRPADDPAGIEVRDRSAGVLETITGENDDALSHPSISGDGRLVGFAVRPQTSGAGRIFVADRRERINDRPVLHPVTGTETDLLFQRMSPCQREDGSLVDCGPQLSGDGRTIVFPARLDPLSPVITSSVGAGEEQRLGPVVDFTPASARHQLRIDTDVELNFSAPPVIEGLDQDAFRIAATTCVGKVGSSCTVDLELVTAEEGCRSVFASVRTRSATPDGQIEAALIGDLPCAGGELPAPREDGCPALPAVRIGGTPSSGTSNVGNPIASLIPVSVGDVNTGTLTVTNDTGSSARVRFVAPGCDSGLVTPVEPDGSQPACVAEAVLGPGEQCTAHVAFHPDAAGILGASLRLVTATSVSARSYRFVAASSQDVVLARTDPSGSGDFAGPGRPAPRVMSIGLGGEIVRGDQPAVSGDGRFVAFRSIAADDSPDTRKELVYRHDAVTGQTVLVSSDRSGRPERDDAREPSISRDGQRIAYQSRRVFGGSLPSQSWVVVKDLRTGGMTIASSRASAPGQPTARGRSVAPALSGDGTTVAYLSNSTELVPGIASDSSVDRVYTRYLEPDFENSPAGERFNELVSVAVDGAASSSAGDRAPAIDLDGAYIAFGSAAQLVADDNDSLEDTYVRRRGVDVTVTPKVLDFGRVGVGEASDPLQVTLRNVGPGPMRIRRPESDSPYAVGLGDCATLHRGRTCTAAALFRPTTTGPAAGFLEFPASVGFHAADRLTVELIGSGSTDGPVLPTPPPIDPGGAVVPRFSVSPAAIRFAPQRFGTSSRPRSVAVRNIGDVPLRMRFDVGQSVSDYAIVGNACQSLLRPGQQCAVQVVFRPAGLAQRSAVLKVVADTGTTTIGAPLSADVLLSGSTVAPRLVAGPAVVRPGRVAVAEGFDFPPNTAATLSWSIGSGSVQVRSDSAGRFQAPMLAFRRDPLGPRLMVATLSDGVRVLSAPVLITPRTGQPPEFITRR
ncbi:choice-of-anchor D domain-containing protein [Kribbella sp. CA-253562]|uniref:choice-of-anchor D domain-containing protein n=1 Tax=Kribbella sp. CA-253562 TaxID=3239942 RepID=UPI003D925E07